MWGTSGESGGDMKAGDILFVDDETSLLDLATALFRCEGVEAYCAPNGEEALRKLRERSFVLMITDFDMPGMDGLELARKAREIAPTMHIALCSGNISPELPNLAKEAGIADVFCKPFKFREILAMVKKKIGEEKNHAIPSF
jgi:DNA-binding response OmpR family regulator